MRSKRHTQSQRCSVSFVSDTEENAGNPEDRDDGPKVQFAQQVLREELRHRKDFRSLCEQRERIIGAKVRQLREQRGWSQADLSDRLAYYGWPLHQTNVSKIESGRRPLRVAEAVALALVFGLPVVALWYLPLEEEPLSLTDMSDRLRDIDDTIAVVEKTINSLVKTVTDERYRRARVVDAINKAALAAERGDIEDLGLDEEQAAALAEETFGQPGGDDMSAEAEAEFLELMRTSKFIADGGIGRIADEALQMHRARVPVDEIARFVATSMPPGATDPVGTAAQILREALVDRPGEFDSSWRK